MPNTNVFTGSNGTLTLASETGPDGDDAKTVVEFFEIQTVGRVSGIEICVQTDLEEFHEIGRRHATSLHPGDIHISGKITRAFINGALLNLLLGRGAASNRKKEPYPNPTFSMVVNHSDPNSPGVAEVLELKGVKIQNWSYTMPEEDFVMENVVFKALTISTISKTAAGGGGAAASVEVPFPDIANA